MEILRTENVQHKEDIDSLERYGRHKLIRFSGMTKAPSTLSHIT